jgi:hypothetical protein
LPFCTEGTGLTFSLSEPDLEWIGFHIAPACNGKRPILDTKYEMKINGEKVVVPTQTEDGIMYVNNWINVADRSAHEYDITFCNKEEVPLQFCQLAGAMRPSVAATAQ